MTQPSINLKIWGPFGLTGKHDRILFNEPEAKQSGIYFMAVPFAGGGYLVTYVGETSTSFSRRLKEHMIQTMGGNYRISDPEDLKRGRDVVLWNGLWRKGTRDKVSEFLDRLPELAPAIQELLRSTVVFTATLDTDRRTRQRIEGALADYVKRCSVPTGSTIPADIRYYRRRATDDPIRVIIDCQFLIHGLLQELEA